MPGNCWDVKITQFGYVNNIANDFKFLAILIYHVVKFYVVCGDYGESSIGEVVFGVFVFYDFDVEMATKLLECIFDIPGNDENTGSGFIQGLDLPSSDGACADYYDAFADEIEVYGVFCHGCNYSGVWLVITENKLHCQRQ